MYITEEAAEIASQYFYEMGLNSDGIRILAEELGPEEFSEFVEDIICSYTLTEARSGGTPRGRQTQKTKTEKHFSDPKNRSASAMKSARTDLAKSREKFYAGKTRGSSQEGGVRGFLGGAENAARQERISQLRAKTGRSNSGSSERPQARGQRKAPATGSRLTGPLASKGEAPTTSRSRTLPLSTRQSEYTRGSVRSNPRSKPSTSSGRATKIMQGLNKSTTTSARDTALETAKKDQAPQKSTPTQRKKSVLDALAGHVLRSWERHNKAWQSPGAQEFRKKLSKAGRLAGNVARDVEAGALATADTVAKDVLGFKEDFELWVNALLDEGYDLSNYTWDDMIDMYEETLTTHMQESNELYSKVISHLISEGYASTLEGAQVIAQNMSDSWINNIIN